MTNFRRHWRKLGLSLVVTVAFGLLFFHNLQGADLLSAMTHIPPVYLVAAVAALAAGYSIRILRWWVMLHRLEPVVGIRACFAPFLVGIALNNVLPFRAGDVVRVVGFRERLQSPPMRVLGTLAVERLLDLLVLLGFFLVALSAAPANAFPNAFTTVMTFVTGLAIIALIALPLLAPWIDRWVNWLARQPRVARTGRSERARDAVLQLTSSLGILRSPIHALLLLGLSVVVWSFEGFGGG